MSPVGNRKLYHSLYWLIQFSELFMAKLEAKFEIIIEPPPTAMSLKCTLNRSCLMHVVHVIHTFLMAKCVYFNYKIHYKSIATKSIRFVCLLFTSLQSTSSYKTSSPSLLYLREVYNLYFYHQNYIPPCVCSYIF